MAKKICNYCEKEIKKKEKQVDVITKEEGVTLEEEYFHFKCWKDWFNEMVSKKIKNTANNALAGLTGFLGGLNQSIKEREDLIKKETEVIA